MAIKEIKMPTLEIILGVIIWLGMGMLGARITYHCYQRGFPDDFNEREKRKDIAASCIFIPFGFFELLASIIFHFTTEK
jgi:hypothetical protein